MSEKELARKLKSSLGYYTWDDIAQCACQVVRKFGVKGARGLLNDIEAILKYINAVNEGLASVKGLVGRLQDFGAKLFNFDPIRDQIMKKLAGVKVCPMLDAMVWRELGGIGFGTDLVVFDWFKDKVELINAYGNRAQKEIRDVMEFLGLLAEMVAIVEDCAVEALPETRSLKNQLKAEDVTGLPRFEEAYGVFEKIVRTDIAKVGNELWLTWERDNKIYVQRVREDRSFIGSAVYVADGKYPRIYYDDSRVYLFFMKNDKGILIIFIPDEIGYFTHGLNLWDCVKTYNSMSNVYQGRWRHDTGVKGGVYRQIDGGYGSFGYDAEGVVPVVSISFSAERDFVQWNDVVVDGWGRSYLVYVNDKIVAEVAGTSYSAEEIGYGDRIYVRVKIWKRFDLLSGNTVVIGCPSNELVFDWPKIIGSDSVSPDSDLVKSVGYVNFVVMTDSVGENSLRPGSDLAKSVGYVNFVVMTDSVGENSLRPGSDLAKSVGYVNFFPATLM